MSVHFNVYPGRLEHLSMHNLLEECSRVAGEITVLESERQKRSPLDWSYLLLDNPRRKGSAFKFVLERNSKRNARFISCFYGGNKNAKVVQSATHYVWSIMEISASLSDRRFTEAMVVHYQLLHTFLRLSNGVIDLPENKRLLTGAGFARHLNELKRQGP